MSTLLTALDTLDSYVTATRRIVSVVNQVILGKETQLRMALTCLLARGHLLIEDLPGVGKTTLAHALAQALGLHFKRIQFTSDLLPADVLGVSIYDRESSSFTFHPGPVFAQLILADEINRATPKTQSALLEAMEERQVTLEGSTHELPWPFFVIATQNPHHQIGTFPLPESQLDRFLMRIRLGYPNKNAERELLTGCDRRQMLTELKPAVDAQQLQHLQEAVSDVHVSEALLDYLQAILDHSRRPGLFKSGLSPRAGLAILRSARAWALIHGREHVLPEDLQRVLAPVVAHRLRAYDERHSDNDELVQQLIADVPIP